MWKWICAVHHKLWPLATSQVWQQCGHFRDYINKQSVLQMKNVHVSHLGSIFQCGWGWVLGYAVLSLQWEIINIVTALEQIHFIRYSMMVHRVLHVSVVQRWLTNLCGFWLVKTMIDFSGCDRWEPSLLMVQNGSPSVLISTHWEEKKSTCWIAGSICDSQVMELSFFLFQIKIASPFPLSFLPSSAILKGL